MALTAPPWLSAALGTYLSPSLLSSRRTAPGQESHISLIVLKGGLGPPLNQEINWDEIRETEFLLQC